MLRFPFFEFSSYFVHARYVMSCRFRNEYLFPELHLLLVLGVNSQ